MTLKPGDWLNHYEVLGHLGTGGMGEVYRARDNKLQREVALKVLPKAFAQDPERVGRFRREAQVLAQLNHTNIAGIYSVEQTGETHFLVMELALGETLKDRIQESGVRSQNKTGIPIEEALDIAKQICAGLECAHEKPIVHRDLKPANVKVTPEGVVKILDFGLARAFAGDSGSSDPSDSPTLTGMTAPGTILGTAAYMSPEQARGKTVDKRTDIWALGCVMYEMLSGKHAFDGEDVPDILGAVLHKEPDWTALPKTTPTKVRELLRRCLQKDRDRRLRDAGDARVEIEEVFAASGTALPAAPLVIPVRAGWLRAMPWAIAVVLSVAVGIGVWMLKPTPSQPVSRMTITLPPGQRLAALDQPAIAISPDGKNLVYVAIQDNPSRDVAPASGRPVGQRDAGATSTQQLYLRPLDSLESKPIAGTEGAVAPFFSPDGQWIGFFAGGRLKKVSVNGGTAVTLASAPNPGGASWSSQGTLALQPTAAAQGLQQVSQEGGTPQPLTRRAKDEFIHSWPEFLPGGKAVLFAGSPNLAAWNNAQIVVQPAGTGERKNLVQGGTQPRYATTGHLLYAQGGTLMAVPFDARRLALTGAAVPAFEGVMESTVTGAAQYSVSSTGTLVYLAGGVAGSQSRLVWVSRNGEEQPLPAAPHNYQNPRVSPDGRRVAVQIPEQETQIWVYDASRDTLTRLTFEGNGNTAPAWSPDGTRIAFRSNRAGGPGNLFWQASDGSGRAERLTTSDYLHLPNSFSPDAQMLAFIETIPETGRDIWVLRLADPATAGQARKAQPFLRTPYDESAAKFSPDGKWLAYSSDESGRREIYVQPYPGPGGKWQISAEGGQEPVWNPKGGELFYRSGSKIMAVEVNPSRDSNGAGPNQGQAGTPVSASFSAGKPRMLFEGPYLPTAASFPYYDVSPDGQRFLMLKPVDSQSSAPTQINVVLNWFEELRRRVPAPQ